MHTAFFRRVPTTPSPWPSDCATWPSGRKPSRKWRVTRPGGALIILDFSLPPSRLLRGPYRFYLQLMPRIAGWITGQYEAYAYLAGFIEKFPSGDAMCEMLDGSYGYTNARAIPVSLGIASIYVAEK